MRAYRPRESHGPEGRDSESGQEIACFCICSDDYYRMKTDNGRMTDQTPPDIQSGKDYYERSLTVALLRAREVTMRRFKRFSDAENLTLPQWRVIRALADGEPLDAGTLCQRCVILPPSLTRILRALSERGLITQVTSSDARRHTVALTPAGVALFDRLVVRSEGIRHRLNAAFGEARMQELLDMLNDLRVVAETQPETDDERGSGAPGDR